MTKKTQTIIWTSVALMMVVISFVTYIKQRPHKPIKPKAPISKTLTDVSKSTVSPTQAPIEVSVTTATSTTTTKISLLPKPKSTPKTLSYGDAVAKYGFNRIQFDPSCRAIPNQIAIKNPVTLMLDNRSSVEQKITVASKSYGVAAYNYVIVTINEKVLPVNLFINCNEQKNVAEMILQK